MPATPAPFDLDQLYEAQEKAAPPPEPTFVEATDGIQLAVRVYEPAAKPQAVLLFYHGGGAHSGAGYHLLAQQLASQFQIQLYTPDLRGHGQSGGPRGDASSPTQVHQDVDTVIEFIQGDHPSIPLFLGGHSSGAGLIIQHATVHNKEGVATKHSIKGYLLLSPQLGPNAGVAKDGSSASSFANVSILPFILNGVFGIMGHNAAVKFQYPEKELTQGGVVAFNTVNMANAISPTDPTKQLEEMSASGLPIKLWIGQKDELFDADKVQALYPASEIVPGATHLGILVNIHTLMGPWLEAQLE